MKLVIAEKPSVAQNIAKVIGAFRSRKGYFEGNNYIVSWCIGHLVEPVPPEFYDKKYKKWSYEALPIFPETWKYQINSATKPQYEILKRLMERNDVSEIICATDAGREGELIFRLVYNQCKCEKPFKRLWISSMEDSAIKRGFESLKSGSEYDNLYEAAICREKSDWLVGMNATRLFSTIYGQTLNVGRVMTPTLSMTVMREEEIRTFKSEAFYTVEINAGSFTMTSERIKSKNEAEKLCESCKGSDIIVTKSEKKEKTENSPALYDLTSLQRDANRISGFTAQQTLDYAQSLYEKKLITYPRTDSRYLTEDMEYSINELIQTVFSDFYTENVDKFSIYAAQTVNNSKVSDHHAIIPTKEISKFDLKELPEGEKEILRLVSVRLICAVSKSCTYSESIIETEYDGIKFSAKGKTVLDMGWRIFDIKKDWDNKTKDLPNVLCGDFFKIINSEIKEGKTIPPKHFTDVIFCKRKEWTGIDERSSA